MNIVIEFLNSREFDFDPLRGIAEIIDLFDGHSFIMDDDLFLEKPISV
jgi:hypothetical protein